jgi:hypothetical protein
MKKSIFYVILALAALITGGIAYQTWGLCLGSITGFIFCGGFIIAAISGIPSVLDFGNKEKKEEIKNLPLLLSTTISRIDEETPLDLNVYWWKTASRSEIIGVFEYAKRLPISSRLRHMLNESLRILEYQEVK